MLLQRPFSCLWSVSLPEATLVSEVHTAFKGPVWVHGGPDVAVNAHGLCCHLRPCRCLWSVLTPEAILLSVGCAVTWGHVDVGDLYNHLGPY